MWYNYNNRHYCGYYYDADLGMYYLRSRYYDQNTGRFINADGYVNANGDLVGFNMFAYCSNNPVMRVDENGKWWNVLIGAAIGGTVSLISSFVEEYFFDKDEFGWEDVGRIVASNVIGSIEGALAALAPQAAPIICAAAAAGDEIVDGLIIKKLNLALNFQNRKLKEL